MNQQLTEQQQFAAVLELSRETARAEEKNRADIAAAIAASNATAAADMRHQKKVNGVTYTLCMLVEAAHRTGTVLRLYERRARNVPQKLKNDARRAAGERDEMFQKLKNLTSSAHAKDVLTKASMGVTHDMVLKWEAESANSLRWHLKSEAARAPAPSLVSNYRQQAAIDDRKVAEDLARRYAAEDRKIAADAAFAARFAAAPAPHTPTAPPSAVSNYSQQEYEMAAAAAVYTLNSTNQVSISGGRVTSISATGRKVTYEAREMGSRHGDHNQICGYLSLTNGNGDRAVQIKMGSSSLADRIANKPRGHFAKLGEMMTEEVLRAYVAIYKTNVCVVNNASGVAAETYIMSDNSSGPMIYIINHKNVHFQRLVKINTA